MLYFPTLYFLVDSVLFYKKSDEFSSYEYDGDHICWPAFNHSLRLCNALEL